VSTTIETVPGRIEDSSTLETLYVNESVPTYPASGVYWTSTLHAAGEPESHVIGPLVASRIP
jgi:hypothetical protein